jgi:hypothetical protein
MRIETQAIDAAGEVELMIRPERLRPGAEGDGADNTFDMTVDDVINYGDSLLVIGKTHGLPLRARMVGGELVEGRHDPSGVPQRGALLCPDLRPQARTREPRRHDVRGRRGNLLVVLPAAAHA